MTVKWYRFSVSDTKTLSNIITKFYDSTYPFSGYDAFLGHILCDIVIFDLRPLHFSSSVRVTRDLSNPPVKVYFLFLSQLQTWNERKNGRTDCSCCEQCEEDRIITHVAATDYDVLNKYHSRRLGSRLCSTNRSGIANTTRLCCCSWLNTNKT